MVLLKLSNELLMRDCSISGGKFESRDTAARYRKNDLTRFNDELSKLLESLKKFISWRN